MQEAVFNFVRVPMMDVHITHKATERRGNRSAAARWRYLQMRARGPNDYVYMLCTSPEMWQAMCTVIGRRTC